MQGKYLLPLCSAPAVAFFAAFWLLPAAQLLALPAQEGMHTYWVVLTSGRYLQALLQTLLLSAIVTLATLILGAMVGIVMARHRVPAKRLLLSLMTLPRSFPGVIVGFFIILLGICETLTFFFLQPILNYFNTDKHDLMSARR